MDTMHRHVIVALHTSTKNIADNRFWRDTSRLYHMGFILAILTLSVMSLTPVSAQDADPTSTPAPVQPPSTQMVNSNLTLERYFGELLQGEVGVMRLQGDNIQEARVLFRSEEYPFIPTANDGWYSLVVADIDSQQRDYPYSVVALRTDGSTVTFDGIISVVASGFIRQVFDVPSDIAYLIDPAVEREEFAQIEAIAANVHPEQYWAEQGWQLPLPSDFTSGFGQYRILNRSVQTRHTGWDQRAFVGTEVQAMASGRVVFADELAIRGNYILIDHGWGIYTGYAHFSEFIAKRGDFVEKGDIIGLSGNTGRSNGAHLHWEIKVNGQWVDGARFLETWLPPLP